MKKTRLHESRVVSILKEGKAGVPARVGYGVATFILFGLAGPYLWLGCSTDDDRQRNHGTEEITHTCGEAKADALRSVLERKYQEALHRYEYALGLCKGKAKFQYGILHGVADITRMAPENCQRASELFRLVPLAEDVDQMRAVVELDYSCSTWLRTSKAVDGLVRLETGVLYGPKSPAFDQLVREYEYARLFRWARKTEEHIRHLERALGAMCEKELLPLAMTALEESESGENPIGGTLGLITLQTRETLSADTEACLGSVSAEIERILPRLPEDRRQPLEQWLGWYRKHLEN